MNSCSSYKTYLIERVRSEIKNNLIFYKSVYSDGLRCDLNDFALKYNITKDQVFSGQQDSDINSLESLKEAVSACTKCGLHLTRKNTVFGAGTGKTRLMIIGEAPGADEDESGEPFVGRAGQLLTKMLSAIGIDRNDAFICNVLKCRPPNNRDPLPDEIAKCSYYLDKQIDFLKPAYILALGRIAALRLLNKQLTMKELRESIYSYKNVPVLVTYHPSALLRNPNWKYPAWDDLKKLKELLDQANG
ncbi:MAG TPA: uracil-DNA glycosylase [Clostridiales bacterium]|nr:uracil-DNA glycosylase [Clostridiales bacterium]HQP70223.1 uracil-DNA glycosylase [Clostridiales bacterium]